VPICPRCNGSTFCVVCGGSGCDVGAKCEACDEDGNGKCGSCNGTGEVSEEAPEGG
jgi:hypothetical protein